MFPLPLAPAHKTKSEPAVCKVTFVFTVRTPVAFKVILPPEEVKLPDGVIVWHWTFIAAAAEMVPAELLVKVPELQVTVTPETPLIAAFTVTLPPVEASVNEFDELGDVTEFETVMVPADSTVVEKDCMCVWRSVFRIFATPLVEDSKLPLTNTPSVVPEEVMFTADAIWLGLIVRDVPRKASEVKVRVLAPTPTFEVNPRSVNVAIPATVRTVTEVTAVPEFPTLSTWPVAVMVTSCSADPSPAVIWIDWEKLLPARATVAVRVTSRPEP